MDRTDEQDLVRRAVALDVGAFTALVVAYGPRVRGYIGASLRRAEVVDDLAQEVFVDAFRTLETFRPEASFESWLLGIARHRVLRHLRSGVRETRALQAVLDDSVLERVVAGTGPEHREGHLVALQACLQRLTGAAHRLVRAYYFDGVPLVVVARQEGRQEGTVRVALLRARQSLRACMQRRLMSGMIEPE